MLSRTLMIVTLLVTLLAAATIADPARATEPSGNAGAAISSPAASAALPTPRPALKKPKSGAFPFKPWSYAKAYTFNFFGDQPVQTRVVTSDGKWSEHIRSELLITDANARRAADLVARTRESIETTKCTFPRHAIVFFDQSDKPVASADVCFSCEAVLAWPNYERPENFNYEKYAKRFEKALPQWRELFEKDLGLPIEYKSGRPVP